MGILEDIQKGYVFADGGMGTMLQERGLKAGELPETWNETHADIIQDVHYQYLKAGSDYVSTNSFGANRLRVPDERELRKYIGLAVDNAKAAISRWEDENSSGSVDENRSGSANENSSQSADCRYDTAKENCLGGGDKCAKSVHRKYAGFDVGPTGRLLKPLGDLDFEEAVSIFAQQIKYGTEAGADFILIETMNDSYELKAAVIAAKENSSLPVFATTAYDSTGKLLTGSSPEATVSLLEGLGVDALGLNCSLGPADMLTIVNRITAASSVPVIVSPNAGLPEVRDGKTCYNVDAVSFAQAMKDIAKAGARVLGGCCGTTPEYIKELVSAVKGTDPVPLGEKNISSISSYTHAVYFGVSPKEAKALEATDTVVSRPVLIGERINPTGKKRFKQALREGDLSYILEQGTIQQDNGADVLDVNVGLPEIDEPEMMDSVMKGLQSVLDLPLQIDTTDPKAMESALRHYNGKPMINSVNAKKEVMDEIFPLAKKYGGLVVGLLIDESGIPETVEGRLADAELIYDTAAKYGIKKKDIIIDALTMSISTDVQAANVTLETVRRLTEMGCLTSLGVSNVSFGLPGRDYLNSGFFTIAMTYGLSAAIMNPHSIEMMKSYHVYRALSGNDTNCERYIGFATGRMTQWENEHSGAALLPDGQAGENAAGASSAPGCKETGGQVGSTSGSTSAASGGQGAGSFSEEDPLMHAVMRGLSDQAGKIIGKLLSEGTDSIEIIDNKLIPALDIVGKGFEEKRVFLPQLLMSAEAAKSAFEQIRTTLEKSGKKGEPKGTVIIATVKGDIHDIGKNIVKVLLQNYDFKVIDLGKDVPPETIADRAAKDHVRLVGLSALMTTTVPAMEETIKQLKEKAPWAKVMTGGAVMTKEYSDMIGADRYCKDAMSSVRYAEEVFK